MLDSELETSSPPVLLQQLMLEQEALRVFVDFTEAASHLEDVDSLARLALQTLQTLIPGSNVVLTELTPTHWQLRHWTDNLAPELLAMAQRQGFPLETPVFADLLETGEPSFTDGWDEEKQKVPNTGQFEAVAHYPIVQRGQVVAAIGLAVTDQSYWSEGQKAIIRSVGRSFSLLYERVAIAEQTRRQRVEAEDRVSALEALMGLTQEQLDDTDPYALIRRAQVLVLDLLPPGFAAYYEPRGGRWTLVAQARHAGSALLQAAIDAGLPLGQTPSFDHVAETREPSFVEVYASATDVDPEVAKDVAAHATLPLLVDGQLRGLFNLPLFESRNWTAADRVLLITTVHTLGLVIERLERAREMARVNAELQSANEELEAFSYSASHDLRTPVRHVKGFAELSQRALERAELEKVGANLTVISQAADRMYSMIDAMLALSRVGRAELKLRPVQLGALVEQARQDVELEFPDRAVTWQVAPLPTVQADATVLQQVMTNLLSNAVKFAAVERPLSVRVWAEQRPLEVAVFVQDTGVGFDPAYGTRLFGAFQRLHNQREFSGTGVGLATVRRIITRHGGKVWAEGRLNEGATFGFSLPR
jgi:signal transduction histidine kinase